MLIKMAWRNLWRHKRRSAITCFSVGFGFFLAMSLSGMAEDSYARTVDIGAAMGLGHVTVMPEGYQDSPSMKRRISGADALRDEAAKLPEVDGAVARIMGQAMFASGGRTQGGQFIAIDPAHERAALNLFVRKIDEGALFEDAGGRGVVVGRKLAQRLRLKLGRKVVLTSTDVHGEIVSELLRVSGIFETGVAEVDAGVALVPIDRLRKTVGYGPTEATMVAAVLGQARHSVSVRDALAAGLRDPQAVSLTWRQTQPDLDGLLAVDRASNQFFQFLVGLLIAAGVLNTLTMSVMERQREFGVLMALGMSPRRLFALLLLESSFIGVVGVLLGSLATAPWVVYMTQVGLDMSSMTEGADIGGIAMDPIIRFTLPAANVAGIVATLLLLTLLSGLYPAWLAGRAEPVESLRVV